MENSPAMIFLKDTQGRYLHFNREFGHVFGLTLTEYCPNHHDDGGISYAD